MFPEAVARYHDLLSNQELAESSRALLDEGLDKAKLIFGGRRLSPYLRPHFVSETDFARICQICETVWSAIQKVKDAAVADPHVVDDLGLTEIERELVAIDPGYVAVSPTSRLDSFLTKSAYSFVELNGESPAGIAYADAAYDIFSSLPVMKEFARLQRARDVRRALHAGRAAQLVRRVSRQKTERAPRIAIVDLPDVPTVKEFELFRDSSNSQDIHRHLHAAGARVQQQSSERRGQEIDIVTSACSSTSTCRSSGIPALLDAYRAGAICMVNSFVRS
jgi:hypothetical protein